MDSKHGPKEKSILMTKTGGAKKSKCLSVLLISSTIFLVVYSSTMLSIRGKPYRFGLAADYLVLFQSSIFISVIFALSLLIKMPKLFLKIVQILTISILFGQFVGFLCLGAYKFPYLSSDGKLLDLIEKFGFDELHKTNYDFMIDLMVLQEEVGCCGLKSVKDWRGIRLLNEIGGPSYLPDTCCKPSKDMDSLCGDKNRRKDIHKKGCSKWLLPDARKEPRRLFWESCGGLFLVGLCIFSILLQASCTMEPTGVQSTERGGCFTSKSQGKRLKNGGKNGGNLDLKNGNNNGGNLDLKNGGNLDLKNGNLTTNRPKGVKATERGYLTNKSQGKGLKNLKN